jgi:hypothetical protein
MNKEKLKALWLVLDEQQLNYNDYSQDGEINKGLDNAIQELKYAIEELTGEEY